MNDILHKARQKDATDIHLSAGDVPAIRIQKNIEFIGDTSLSNDELVSFLRENLDDRLHDNIDNGRDINAILEIDSVRYRINAFKDNKGWNVAFRYLPPQIPTFEELNLPPALREMIKKDHGLILIVAPTGNGKTTTRSALVNEINTTAKKHIISLEDTIEYEYESDQSLIDQRIVGKDGHIPSYVHALHSALREDPDIISIGDLRDTETIKEALIAAQTGHLVIAEVHADSTYHALNRIISSFPETTSVVQEQLAQQLVGVIAQRLIPNEEGKLVLASEVLKSNEAVRNLIRRNQLDRIADTIRAGRDDGMHLLEDHITYLVEQNVIVRS